MSGAPERVSVADPRRSPSLASLTGGYVLGAVALMVLTLA